MPCKGVAIDVDSGIGGSIHVVLHGGEIHVAIAVHAARHLHGIASNRLCEVLVNQTFVLGVVEIRIYGCTDAEFEIGVLRVINVFFERLILVQVSVVIVVRFSQLEALLCQS